MLQVQTASTLPFGSTGPVCSKISPSDRDKLIAFAVSNSWSYKGIGGRTEAGADGKRGRATCAKELVFAVYPGGQAEGGAGDAAGVKHNRRAEAEPNEAKGQVKHPGLLAPMRMTLSVDVC